MTLNTKDLDNFKAIYESKFNIKLTEKQALEYATSLVNLMKILLSNTKI
jgi:hypothetical protein